MLLDIDAQARAAAAIDPGLLLAGDLPRLIDEWQLEPAVWNHVRRRVDEGDRYILTGSAMPADDLTRHTGAGRVARLRMRPMTLFEAGTSSAGVSLEALFGGDQTRAADPGLDLDGIIDEVCRGGWPGFRDLALVDARRSVADYLAEVERADVARADGTSRDPQRIRALLRSFARNVSTRAAVRTLAIDAQVSPDTASTYLDALARVMVVEDLPAWTPHLRSRADLRTSPVRQFADPSLAVAALGATPEQLRRDLEWLGLLFESLVIRDLRVYAQALPGRVSQYRDNKGVEVDAIVETADGRWSAFEIKLGAGRVDEAASSLLRFARKIDVDRTGSPTVLGVIVGTGYGYVREDGTHVIPIGALGP